MRNKTLKVFTVLSLISLTNCSQEIKKDKTSDKESSCSKKEVACSETKNTEPHQYGGWYCPDNLNGFPAVAIANWKNVPVINGRMATQDETQTEAALINVDMDKYPNAKVLDMKMPQLASIYDDNSGRKEFIIIIQALNIQNDSIVGFRYLNGGNGSARLHEVEILSDNDTKDLQATKFVTYSLTIENTQDEIWKVLTDYDYAAALQPTFDQNNLLKTNWRTSSNVNYHYAIPGILTGSFAGNIYGCYYVQNDYDYMNYTQKFLLLEDEHTHHTELKITCGPYGNDYEKQKNVLINWAKKLKEISEANK